MSKETKHPHKENPSIEEIREVLESASATKDSEVKDVYLAVHTVMLKALPDLRFSMDMKDGKMGYGAKQYGYDGWGIAGLVAHGKWVNLHFMRGAELEKKASSKALEGKGKQLRHMKFKSTEDVEKKEKILQELLEQASIFNESGGNGLL